MSSRRPAVRDFREQQQNVSDAVTSSVLKQPRRSFNGVRDERRLDVGQRSVLREQQLTKGRECAQTNKPAMTAGVNEVPLDTAVTSSAIARAGPVRCAQKLFPSAEALGKENLLALNEWHALRLPALGMEREGDDGRFFLPSSPPAGRSRATKTSSPIPNAVSTMDEFFPARFAVQPAPPAMTAPAMLRPVREHPRYKISQRQPQAPGQRNSHSQKQDDLNRTWPNGKEAWSSSVGRDSKGHLISRLAALSVSAPSLSDRVDEMFGCDAQQARSKRTNASSSSVLRHSEKLALSLPSVVQLPSIAEESSSITAAKRRESINLPRQAHDENRKRRRVEKQAAKADEEHRLERRKARKASKRMSAEEKSFAEEHEFRKMQKATRDGAARRKESTSTTTVGGRLHCLLPELTASTPYLTATRIPGKDAEPGPASTTHAFFPHIPASQACQGSLSVDCADPCDIVLSDSDVDLCMDLNED